MFNIIETPPSYFTRELLHDSLSSDVVNFADGQLFLYTAFVILRRGMHIVCLHLQSRKKNLTPHFWRTITYTFTFTAELTGTGDRSEYDV